MVVSAQEGVSSCTDSKVTASSIHQDVQLMRWREGGVETERFIKCVVIKRFVKVTLGLHCETDYVQSQKLNLSLPP